MDEHAHDRQRGHAHDHGEHGHTHGLVDRSIMRSRAGIRAVLVSLAILGVTALVQTAIFVATGSVALLADLVHNFGDAATAIPVGIAFYLRSFRAEKIAGLFVVLAIFVSACVALYETILRFIDPQPLSNLGALAAAGILGFVGNEIAAQVTAARRSPAREPGTDRGRKPRAGRRLRLARRRRQRDRRGARLRARRPDRRPRHHARDPQDHVGLVADRARRGARRARCRP